MEVPAPAAGVLREIVLDIDADAVPGAVLGRIATEVEAEAPRPEPDLPSPPKPGARACPSPSSATTAAIER